MAREWKNWKGRHLMDGQPRGYRPSTVMKAYIHQRDPAICSVCGATDRLLEVAHIKPWPDGPTDVSNLRLLCRSCNLKERRRWGQYDKGLLIGAHKAGDTDIRAIMEKALAH